MLPDKYVKSGDRERFLQFCGRVDTVEEGGILLFYTPTGANVLAGSKALFADGTFATCPPLFAQIYMVFGQLPNNGKVVPCAYALLPNKQHTTYSMLWAKIKEGLPSTYSPDYLMIDFEASASKGFLENFPAAKVTGCHFHFSKNIIHQLGQKGCLSKYNKCQEFQQLVKLMQALAFLPADDVAKAWEQVIEPFFYRHQDILTESMDDFIDYFIATYVGKVGRNRRRGNPKIKLDMWTKFNVVKEQMPCTNNAVEAFNRAWNRSTPSNASLWTILDGFLREEMLMKNKLHEAWQQDSPESHSISSRQLQVKQKEEKIFRLVAQYTNMNLDTYLKEIVSALKL